MTNVFGPNILKYTRKVTDRYVNNFMRTSLRLMRFYSSVPTNSQPSKKVTITTIQNLYKNNEPITVLTAHDYPSGLFVEKTGIEICLVGDSLGMVALGRQSINQTTIEEMLHHCRAVSRGAKTPFLVCDMPFGSYEISPKDALRNAIRFIKEGNMEAIKLEGGTEMAKTIQQITSIGIPVLGHIGLTPQRQSSLGGFRVQGKTAKKAIKLLDDAKALQQAGCFAIVMEAIPGPVAAYITEQIQIPTIGIGAGSGTTLMTYREEVKSRTFPDEEYSYTISDDELKTFFDIMKKEQE
ncbi:17930_t:CDS:2 [Cetraspora pellucida]|uniref:3-methyl-2-oxobutanoate hydroxymethyltransferase n=1 Tax=Cetraspora pellucida TaxID=1433469 RepID=A0A9N9ALC9_9GLOM|nr:17930_t:CDS:2 [Cetraspora pellucida]